MKKLIFIIGFLVILLGVAGCKDIDLSKLSKEDINKLIVCEKPYMRYASECCLDQNDNKVCDSDEGSKTQTQSISTDTTPTSTSQSTPTPQSTPSEITTEQCSKLNFEISSVDCTNKKLTITNNGNTEIKSLKFRLYNPSGIDIEDNPTLIKGFDIKTLTLTKILTQTTKIEAIPNSCNNIILSYESPCIFQPHSLSLADYPQPFVVNKQYDESTLIVIGSNAPASDLLSAVDIATGLQYESGTVINVQTKTDIEVNNPANHLLILVGNPCGNPLIEKISGDKCATWSLKSGEALIRLVANGDKIALIVAGTDAIDTRRVAKIIRDYKDYQVMLQGETVIVTSDTLSKISLG